jgi:hypothetical protein
METEVEKDKLQTNLQLQIHRETRNMNQVSLRFLLAEIDVGQPTSISRFTRGLMIQGSGSNKIGASVDKADFWL